MKNVSKKARTISIEVYILVNGRITHKSRFALFHPEGTSSLLVLMISALLRLLKI